jgi:hypothetical protein
LCSLIDISLARVQVVATHCSDDRVR